MTPSDPMLPLALLAGGLATRLYPLTETIPKSMIEVAGEPFIAHQLRLLHQQNIRDVVICAGFLAESIRAYVGSGNAFGLNVTYCLDGERLLGTGGALKQALPFLGDAFFVMYGDSYLPTAFAPVDQFFRQAASMQGVMTVFKNDGIWDRSNVLFHDGRILAYDKRHPVPEMHHIDYGLGILTPEAFDAWPAGSAFDLAQVYEGLLQQDRLAGYEVVERFYEIGSSEGLQETSMMLSSQRPVSHKGDHV